MYEDSGADLVRAAFVLVGDVHRAEDLVQTALYRGFIAWPRLRSKDAAGTYVRTTMIRLALRWRTRRWAGEIASADMPERVEFSTDDRTVSDLDLWRALSTLSVQHRAVLVLRYLEDLTEADTAAVLRCSVGTVKSRTRRAIAALRSSGVLLTDDHPEVRHD